MSDGFGAGSYHEVPNTNGDLVYWLAADSKLYFTSRKRPETGKEVTVHDLRADLINLSKLIVSSGLEFKLKTAGELVSFTKANDVIYMIFDGATDFSINNVQETKWFLTGYYENHFGGNYNRDIFPLVKHLL